MTAAGQVMTYRLSVSSCILYFPVALPMIIILLLLHLTAVFPGDPWSARLLLGLLPPFPENSLLGLVEWGFVRLVVFPSFVPPSVKVLKGPQD